MNAPLNQEEFKNAFLHIDSIYKLVNDIAILGAVRPAHYPLVFDNKLTLAVNYRICGDYILTLYKDDFRSVKTFRTMVERWIQVS